MQHFDWHNLQKNYTTILKEILAGTNLQQHLKDITTSIEEIEKIIQAERLSNNSTPTLDNIKNDLYYLKSKIIFKKI